MTTTVAPAIERPAGAGLTSVHALETNGEPDHARIDRSHHPLSLQSRSQRRAHAPYARDRSRLVGALWSDGGEDLGRRALRLAACCQLPTLRLAADGMPRADLARCRDRLCPLCGTMRGWEVEKRVERCVAKADALRLCTLTLMEDGKGLAARLSRLLSCFRALRQTPEWRSWSRGSVAVVEFTLGGSNRHWHCHLHVLVDGVFIPHAKLKALWHKVTGDSFIVDLRAVHGKRAAVKYVAAYVGKPMNIRGWTDEELREYARAVHGRRLLSTAGSMHNPKDDTDADTDVPAPSTHLCAVHAIHAAETKLPEHVGHAADILSRLSQPLAAALDRPPPSCDTTLPAPDPREVQWAVDVLQQVEAAWPGLPRESALEQSRRHFFSLPDPPPTPREVQGRLA